jgi:hypothetical protein
VFPVLRGARHGDVLLLIIDEALLRHNLVRPTLTNSPLVCRRCTSVALPPPSLSVRCHTPTIATSHPAILSSTTTEMNRTIHTVRSPAHSHHLHLHNWAGGLIDLYVCMDACDV